MSEDFELEHYAILVEAHKRYKAASRVRGQMWLDFPPSDKIRELRERVARIEAAYKVREELFELEPQEEEYEAKAGLATDECDHVIEEDAIDLMNYAAFLVKQVRRRMTG